MLRSKCWYTGSCTELAELNCDCHHQHSCVLKTPALLCSSTLSSQVGAFVTVSNVIQSCSTSSSPASNTQASPSPSPLSGSTGSPTQLPSPPAGTSPAGIASPEAGAVNLQMSQTPTPASIYGFDSSPGGSTLSELQSALGNPPATPTPGSNTPAAGDTTPSTPSTGSTGRNDGSPST